jgi:hypothetical protein
LESVTDNRHDGEHDSDRYTDLCIDSATASYML